ncbi:hypothetical protein RJ639_003847 [Escallonia herrerae]|uniref:Alpha/beta hydrolase fold-3 domain-containing protein n=1 Tax=Escallonia herrerae TaxID=1293975 RepID=A0AA89AXI4_9ASTE|nr:hypothetical protein RJ639_003847 [Escallonia herrerae]
MEGSTASLSLPWKTRVTLSLISTVTDASRRRNGTVNRRLLSMLGFKSPPSPNPVNGVKSFDVAVDPSRGLWFRVYVPTAAGKLPVVVFFHGGGFVYLSADGKAYDAVCRRFARTIPAVVVSVDYRLAPEHRYPAQYDDGFDVQYVLDPNLPPLPDITDNDSDETKAARKKREEDELVCRGHILNALSDRLYDLFTSSKCPKEIWKALENKYNNEKQGADKFLTLKYFEFTMNDSESVLDQVHQLQILVSKLKDLKVEVIGLVAIQPFFGGEERTEAEKRLVGMPLTTLARTDFMWKAFLPPGSDRDHEAVNVSGPRAVDISKLEFPATMVVVAGFDMLQDWQRRYYEWLRRSGKEASLREYPNTIHAFYIFPELPESGQLMSEVREFVQQQMEKR